MVLQPMRRPAKSECVLFLHISKQIVLRTD
jgi:hypothetical protein